MAKKKPRKPAFYTKKLHEPLRVTRVLPEWHAVAVESANPYKPLKPAAQNIVTALGGISPSSDVRKGAIIKPTAPVILGWDVTSIADDASGLQSFCVEDYFRTRHSLVVICGEPGTGKSYVRDRLIKRTRKKGINVVCLGPTGLVRQSMPDGYWQGKVLPSMTVAMFLLRPPEASGVLKNLHVFVDEYVMVGARELDRLWTYARKCCPKARVTLIGDHAQLWPVNALPPWSSRLLQDAQRKHDMAVYRLTHQQRFGECHFMKQLMHALRKRDVPEVNAKLLELATRPAPSIGTCRLLAATNAKAQPANDCVHEALATHARSARTRFYTDRKTFQGETVEFCNGERVRICTNKLIVKPGHAVQYEYVTGQEGIIENLPGGDVEVKETSRINVRLLHNNILIQVMPLNIRQDRQSGSVPPEAKSGDDVTPKQKRRRIYKPKWSFKNALRASSGQTVHGVQGATFNYHEKCVVNLQDFPESIEGWHMLIVALSRVRKASNLYVINFDPDIIVKLANACGCGCSSGVHPRSHNQSRLDSFRTHLAALNACTRGVFSKPMAKETL